VLERHNRQTKTYSKSGSGGSETFVAPFSLKFKNLDSNRTAPDRQLSLAPTGNFACPVLSTGGLGYRDLAVFP